MKKPKINPELFKEELKRMNRLMEYDFYQEEKEDPQYEEKPLILGSDLEEVEEIEMDDEEPENEEPIDKEPVANDMDDAVNNISSELGIDDEESIDGDETEDDMSLGQPPMEQSTDDDVEVDVTSLVQGSEEAKDSADRANRNSEILLQKLTDLENRISKMDIISSKINDLEQEIIKRNPTPVEKLEMRSLDSFPYKQKLTDYWNDEEEDNLINDKAEYILTKDDVNYDYSEGQIKKSFDYPSNNNNY